MDPSSLLTTSAVVGGILTLSLQTTIGNIFGGVALQLDGSIHVGDWLQLENGKQGVVKEIRWRHTVVETRDWDTIIVPNAALLGSNITILGKRAGKPVLHRMTVPFNVDFRFAPNQVIDVVTEGLQAAPINGVASDPPPFAFCYDFAKEAGRDSFGYYAARYWLTDLPNDDAANSRVRARVYSALKRADIPLARPVQTTFFLPEEDEQTRAARHRERRLKLLRGLELFKSLNEQELMFLSDHLAFQPHTVGELITKKGAHAHCLYILTAGSVDVLTSVKNGPKKSVATIEAPGVFGEMGLMTGEPRSADVVAQTEIECYRLDKEAFEDILTRRPEIAEAMSKMLAHRRVELDAIREGLDLDSRTSRELTEQKRILGRIQHFFGLERCTATSSRRATLPRRCVSCVRSAGIGTSRRRCTSSTRRRSHRRRPRATPKRCAMGRRGRARRSRTRRSNTTLATSVCGGARPKPR
jgi:CRP-like cAMP-binding protein